MLFTFLQHQWTGFWRSKSKGGHIVAQVFMALMIIYLLACAGAVGFFMSRMIPAFFPEKDLMEVFNGLILYYFAIDFILRLQMQELPTLAIVPYMHLNIPKHKLVNFLNFRSAFSAFNVFPIFIFVPFCLLHISNIFGIFTGIMYIVSILSLALFNNYFALYVKRLSIVNIAFVATGLTLLVTFGLLEYFKIFSIAALSNTVFSKIAVSPLLAFAFPVLAISTYIANAAYLRKNLYLEELKSGEEKKSSTDYPFLDRFGAAGALVALEIKLILRNKRTKSTVSKGLLFLFYGLLLYKKEMIQKEEFGMMIFAAVFMTGNIIMLYGQFMFGWQSAEFDGLLVNKLSIKDFIKAKFLLFTLSSTVLFVLASFYGLISWKILLIQSAAYLYSVGIATVMVLYMATRNYKAIDLSKGSSFNWQGVGATSMLMGLPIFLLPFVIFLPFYYMGSSYLGIFSLAGFGLIGCFTRNFWIDFLVKEFNKRKYKIAEGFRER